MACGVHLRILLICLVQAEHVRCLWETQGQSSHRQNGNKYVGFTRQDSGLGRPGGSYLHNELRQASPRSSSFNTQTAVSSRGLSSSGSTQRQPAHSGYSSVRLIHRNSLPQPNWQATKWNQATGRETPKAQSFGLSTAIASGSSVSMHGQKQSDLSDVSESRTWPVQQGTPRASKYLSGSSASVQSFSQQSAAKKAPGAAAARTPTYYGRRSYSPVKSSSLFSAGAPVQQRKTVQMQTSATVKARRVPLRRGSKASTPSSFSPPQAERIKNNPVQAEAGQRHQSKLFPRSYKPASTSSQTTSYVSSSQPLSNKQNLEKPSGHRLSYISTKQVPSSVSSLQTSWNSGAAAQGARNFPDSGSSRSGTSSTRFAPSRTFNIPQRFGGYAIRRLKEPADQKRVSVSPPQQTYRAPSRKSVFFKPQAQSVKQETEQRMGSVRW